MQKLKIEALHRGGWQIWNKAKLLILHTGGEYVQPIELQKLEIFRILNQCHPHPTHPLHCNCIVNQNQAFLYYRQERSTHRVARFVQGFWQFRLKITKELDGSDNQPCVLSVPTYKKAINDCSFILNCCFYLTCRLND